MQRHEPDEELHARRRLAMLENMQERVEERRLGGAFAAVQVKENPKGVHASNGLESATDNAVA